MVTTTCTFGNASAIDTTITCSDSGSYTATLTVQDGGDGPVSDSVGITVNNLAPAATFSSPDTVEGSPIELSLTNPSDASSVDVDAGFTYAFDCGTGGGYGAFSSTNQVSCPTTVSGTRSIGGKIKDKDGGVSEYTDTVTIAVSNHDPVVDVGGTLVTMDEGQTATITGTYSDQDTGQTITFTTSAGTITKDTPVSGEWTWTLDTTDGPDESQTITITADDGHSGSATTSFSLTVNNVTPTVTFSNSNPTSVDESSTADRTFSFTVSDPGADTVASVTTGCGANGAKQGGADTSVACRFDDGPSTPAVSARATDSDGDQGSLTIQSVDVNNIAPTATSFNVPDAATEGARVLISLTGPSDPSSADTTADFAYEFSCGGGTVVTASAKAYAAQADAVRTNSILCRFDDGPGSYTVSGKIVDKDGGERQYTDTITVSNVTLTATLTAPDTVNRGQAFTLSLTNSSDPSNTDTGAGFSYAFDCGDGQGLQASSNTSSCTAPDRSLLTVMGRITDKDGESSSYSRSVTVNGTKPVATAPVHRLVAPSTLGASAIPVTLTWSGNDGSGVGVARYELQRSQDAGSFVTVARPTAPRLDGYLVGHGHTYRFRLRAIDRNGNVGEYTLGAPFSVNAYNDGSTAITYSSGWTRSALTGSYGGFVKQTSVAGRKAAFTFTGSYVAWASTRGPDRGIAEVYSGGVKVATVDLYSATQQTRQIVFARYYSQPGPHTLEVRVLGTKNSASTGTRVDVDAFAVLR